MFLLVAATEFEMEPARQRLHNMPGISFLVTGVGPLETAVNLTRFIDNYSGAIQLVINFGVGGAYPDAGVEVLDLCLARQEVMGDFGVCFDNRIESFTSDIAESHSYALENSYLEQASQLFQKQQVRFQQGTFVTVNCVSGTTQRGLLLRDTYQAVCENMEGAAVARVCREFDTPMLELRCISNMVEDRDKSRWKIQEAAQKSGAQVAEFLTSLQNDRSPVDKI